MNIDKLIIILIGSLMAILLFVLPLAYSIAKNGTEKTVRFTWFMWAIVWTIFTLSMPGIVQLHENAGYPVGNSDPVGEMGFAVVFGWLPGLLFAGIGKGVNYLYRKLRGKQKHQEDIVVNKNITTS